MADNISKDLINKLADRGEEAISRLADVPGTSRILEAITAMRERLDELQRRVRGLDTIEQRVAELEKRVDELSGAKRSSPSSTSGTRRASSAKPKSATPSASASAPSSPEPSSGES
jgi:hypothetical protein